LTEASRASHADSPSEEEEYPPPPKRRGSNENRWPKPRKILANTSVQVHDTCLRPGIMFAGSFFTMQVSGLRSYLLFGKTFRSICSDMNGVFAMFVGWASASRSCGCCVKICPRALDSRRESPARRLSEVVRVSPLTVTRLPDPKRRRIHRRPARPQCVSAYAHTDLTLPPTGGALLTMQPRNADRRRPT